jgi:hypothetical protein
MVSMKFVRCMTAATALAAALVLIPQVGAQSRRRHETTVNRQYRLTHAIQDTYTHRWEIAAGSGFLRFEPGPFLRRDNQIDWATSAAYYLTPEYGIVAEVSGHFGDVKLNNPSCTTTGAPPVTTCSPSIGAVHPLVTEYTFMAGPQWRFYRKEKYAASVHVTAGDAMGNFDGGSKGVPAPLLGMWADNNKAFAAGVGVDLDYNFYPNFAFRLEPNYVYTHFGGASQNNKGLNFELVYRFGRQ